MTITGLTPGRLSAFRVRVLGSNNQLSDRSGRVSPMAI